MRSVAIFGATGGLGSAVAKRIGRTRPILVGYGTSDDKAREILTSLGPDAAGSDCAQVDIRNPDSVAAFLARADTLGDGLGDVISAIGAPFPVGRLCDADPQEFRNIFELEVFGTFNILKASASRLEAKDGGAIVIFLTTAVLSMLKLDGMNSVPKAAMHMMLRHVAQECGPNNVRVNAIAPGVIDAGITDLVPTLPPLVQKMMADCLAHTPLPRLGRPEEVSALAEFLVSAEAAYINGQVIGLDGGYSA